MKNIWVYIGIGLVIGVILGATGNLIGKNILAYDAECNFAGDAGIDKDGNLIPTRPIPHMNTLFGGVVIGAIYGVLLGIIGYLLKETWGMIIGGVLGFFTSGLICSPYFFYPGGLVPPVAHEKAPYVFIPGIILGVGIIIFFNRVIKPPEMREVVVEEIEETEKIKKNKNAEGKDKHQQKHKKKK